MAAGLYFLVAFMIFKGDVLAKNSEVKIQALVGESVVLPCEISVSSDPSAEWSKDGLKSDIVFLYQSGCETFQMKNPIYHHRTSLFINKVHRGNFSLTLSNVQMSDTGRYTCKTLDKTPPRTVATVELFVGSASEPKISVQPSEGGGVTLQCDTGCWFPKPEITIHDPQEKIISADPTTSVPQSGCFNTTTSVTVQTGGRFTCSVMEPKINQLKVAEIYIPENCVSSCFPLWKIITPAVIVTVIALCISFYCCWNSQSVEGRKSSNISKLKEENAKLKENLREKDETIRRQADVLESLRSNQRPVVHNQNPPINPQNLPINPQNLPIIRQNPPIINPPIIPQNQQITPQSLLIPHKSPSKSSPGVSKPDLPSDQPPSGVNPEPAFVKKSKPQSKGIKSTRQKLSISPQSWSSAASSIEEEGKEGVGQEGEGQGEEWKEGEEVLKTLLSRSNTMSVSQPHGTGAKLQRRSTISISSNRYWPLEDAPNDD